MQTLRLQILFMAVFVLVISSAVAYGDYFLNDPYVVASGGLQWRSDAAYNPAA